MPRAQQRIQFNGAVLTDHQTLASAGVKSDDMLIMARFRSAQQTSSPAAPRPAGGAQLDLRDTLNGALQRILGGAGGTGAAGAQGGAPNGGGTSSSLFGRPAFDLAAVVTPFTKPSTDSTEAWVEMARNFARHVNAQSDLSQAMQQHQPNVYAAVKESNLLGLAGFLKDMAFRIEERRLDNLVRTNPNHPDAQKHIEDVIRRKDIENQRLHALEHNPEAFTSVHMLYCAVEVNKTPVTALIDTGAQITIMSKNCAEKCGLMRFVDTRLAGFARGVGESKILGKIHAAVLKIGTQYLDVSISVIEQNTLSFIFGLDMMRKHGAVIDLMANSLKLGNETIPFLGEGEMPDRLKGSNAIKESAEIMREIALEQEIAEEERKARLDRDAAAEAPIASIEISNQSKEPEKIPEEEDTSNKTDDKPQEANQNESKMQVDAPPSEGSSTTSNPQNQPSNDSSSISTLQSAPSGSPPSGASSVDASHVRQLAEMAGVPEEIARQALESANGDMDVAANILFS